MQKTNKILEKIQQLDNKVIESEIFFSDRVLILDNIINIYKVRQNIANLKQNEILANTFGLFIDSLSVWQGTIVNIKMVSITKEDSFRLFIFDENLDILLAVLKLKQLRLYHIKPA